MTTTRDNNEKECARRVKKKLPGGRACKQRAQRRAKQGTMRDKKYRDKTKREARTK
jgi:hypothetical protein